MKILIVGRGGREHALGWKISKSELAEKIYFAPGNGGTALVGENIEIEEVDLPKLLDFALQHKIDFTVVGPEASLVEGVVDLFEAHGLLIFGPSQSAAKIEGSKVWAKDLLLKYGIPTALSQKFSDFERAKNYLQSFKLPAVIKADGLAAGKGVSIVKNCEEGLYILEEIMLKKKFGRAGDQVLIEEFLTGEEVSIMALTDGNSIIPLLSCQDHKKIGENDTGPNTGGMGAYAPTPFYTPEISSVVEETILKATLTALKKENINYRGVLYAGLMLTSSGPKVLEFNCRFGDPETQAILPLLQNDLLQLLLTAAKGKLQIKELEWEKMFASCVVLASAGYPSSYETGKVIYGLDEVGSDILLLHSGTKRIDDTFVTAGGRVLNVVAKDKTLESALKKTYEAVAKINFEGCYYRRDIGFKALSGMEN